MSMLPHRLKQNAETRVHGLVGSGLRPLRNHISTTLSLNRDCGEPGVFALPHNQSTRVCGVTLTASDSIPSGQC